RPPGPDSPCRGFAPGTGIIQVGRTVTRRLADNDPMVTSDSTYFNRWILPVLLNQTFTVDLTADDFDAFLLLTRGRGDKLVDNDDGGGGCNSRLVYTATDDHPLRVVVSTVGAKRATGRYTLRVADGALPIEAKGNCRFSRGGAVAGGGGGGGGAGGPPVQRRGTDDHAIAAGQRVTGQLTTGDDRFTDTTYNQRW